MLAKNSFVLGFFVLLILFSGCDEGPPPEEQVSEDPCIQTAKTIRDKSR